MAIEKLDISKIPTPPTASNKGQRKSQPRKVASAKPPPPPIAPAQTKVSVKSFSVQPWNCAGEGKRILIYGESGMGKTTLASMAPLPVFIGIDDGGKLIPGLRNVPGITDFADVRAALQADIYDGCETIIIDQVTYLQEWAVDYVLANITNDKGVKMDSIVRYGYNKGYQHLYDTMKLILVDCDALIRRDKNVIIIAQSTPHNIANPGGEDFLREGPRLYSGKNANIEALYCEWADHIFRIGYQFSVVNENKKITGTDERAVFVHPEPHFRAKSRTLGLDKAVVAFAGPDDDSIWQFLFDEEIKDN